MWIEGFILYLLEREGKGRLLFGEDQDPRESRQQV